MTALPSRAILAEPIDVFEMAEQARIARIAEKWVLTPAQTKASDYRNGDLVRADDGDTDPYFLEMFR